MNYIAVNEDLAQGIHVDTSHTPLGITLPSGHCVLAFTVSLDDGSSALGKKIGLSFIDRTTRRPVPRLQIVKDDQNQWRYTSVQMADASGTVSFELQVPVPLPGNLEIVAVLMGEPKYFDGRNRLTFIPTEHVVDHSGQVDRLEVVRGTPQWTQLATGKPFAALVVKASHNRQPVDGAQVTWRITADTSHSGTTVSSAPVNTADGGLASTTPTVGKGKGVVTVTASCNGHTAEFKLTVLPAWADLALLPDTLPVVVPGIATQPQPVRVALITRGNLHEAWPNIPCRFKGITHTHGNLIAEGTPATNTLITSDAAGRLPLFYVRFSSPVLPHARGSVEYQAYLPGNDSDPVSATVTQSVR